VFVLRSKEQDKNMALNNYLKQTMRFLREERQDLINAQDLIDYINIARGQVAGEGECIRQIGTINTSPSVSNYQFSSVTIGTASVTGIQGIINVKAITYSLNTPGQVFVAPRPWEWFTLYNLTGSTATGFPVIWSQYDQGAAPPPSGGSNFGGSFYIYPMTTNGSQATMYLDCVCWPITLINDSTIEAIPYLWSDAVPFLAAYYALIQLQLYERADQMFNSYQRFMQRARQFANPSVQRWQYEQASDPVVINKLGMQRSSQGAS